jgi:threonyl-tRNA synthetase
VVVVGEKEVENQTVNVRSRDRGELGELTLEAFVSSIEAFQK